MKDKLAQLKAWGCDIIPIINNTNNTKIQEMFYIHGLNEDICIPDWDDNDVEQFVNLVYRYC